MIYIQTVAQSDIIFSFVISIIFGFVEMVWIIMINKDDIFVSRFDKKDKTMKYIH